VAINKSIKLMLCVTVNTYTCDTLTPIGMAHFRIKDAAFSQIHGYSASMISTAILYNKLDWSLCTCLTQLYGGIDMYNLLHKEQLHVSALSG